MCIRDRFQAVYIAAGKDGEDFGLSRQHGPSGDTFCMERDGVGYFAGGELIGDTPFMPWREDCESALSLTTI